MFYTVLYRMHSAEGILRYTLFLSNIVRSSVSLTNCMSEQIADVTLSHKFSGLNVRPLFKVLVNYISVIGASLSEPHTIVLHAHLCMTITMRGKTPGARTTDVECTCTAAEKSRL